MLSLSSGNISYDKVHPMRIGIVCEDFETGDLSSFNWQQDGNTYWEITNSFPFEGFYSLKSGDISGNQSSEIYLQYEVMEPDSITFFRKVSSEEGYDFLRFYINNDLAGEWSGNNSGWRRESFPVGSGMNTFRWVYMKDGGLSVGSDCGWIDYIVLPTPVKTTLFAGLDNSTCEDNGFQVMGEATDYDDFLWETSGTGVFNSMTTLTPVYTPSETDILNGSVTITLTVWGTDEIEYTDQMILTIEQVPGAPSMPVGPDYVDLSDSYISDYSTEAVTGINTFNWVVEPEEAGIFNTEGNSGTIVWDRNFAGEAVIYAEIQNSCGNGPMSEGIVVTVENTTVGTTELSITSEKIKVYPNPNNGQFSVMISKSESTPVSIDLLSLAGQLIDSRLSDQPDVLINFSRNDLPPGIYLLVAKTDKWVETRKVIIR
jgi:hypothetical protein